MKVLSTFRKISRTGRISLYIFFNNFAADLFLRDIAELFSFLLSVSVDSKVKLWENIIKFESKLQKIQIIG